MFCDLGSVSPSLQLRVLETLDRAAQFVDCESLAKKICDAQLSLQRQDASNRGVASVSALKEGQQVPVNCVEVDAAITGKPAMTERAKEKLLDTPGMCEAAINGVPGMMSCVVVKPVCLFFKAVSTSSAELPADDVCFANLSVRAKFSSPDDFLHERLTKLNSTKALVRRFCPGLPQSLRCNICSITMQQWARRDKWDMRTRASGKPLENDRGLHHAG